mmetsp:Transcript_25112/g.35374  ORF Transcript_25112/g.35374 Transcript_25112/m.35374 type:complete len:89 (-) Transcript_25112:280-546(-)
MAISSQTISVGVAVIAFFQLSMSGALDTMADGFFNFDLADQIGTLAVVFSVIFAAVSMSSDNASIPSNQPPAAAAAASAKTSNSVKQD